MKKIIHTKRGWKQDANRISTQAHEIEFVQHRFFMKASKDENSKFPFKHPSVSLIKKLIKLNKNMRVRVYRDLEGIGYKIYRPAIAENRLL